ncbi:MAG: hypothetical protein JWQ63_1433 [Mucilaginibacter sp.]|nr:hypothetical protein [Mucilaginibacter sp.]
MTSKQTVITIATGKKLYLDLAANLARSFFWWHPDTDIAFKIVTDNEAELPDDVKKRAEILTIKPGEFGKMFSPKLYLDQLAPEGSTIFIDSDCLIFGNLSHLFDLFKGNQVSVIGGYISSGEWFGDISAICRKFNVAHLPKFNGGLYYVEKGNKANEIYQTARELEKKYDEIGFVRLRNHPNDEVLMALAMQLHGQTPVIDDGTIMSDPQACPGGYKINVVTGERWLINPPKQHPLHQSWYPFEKVSPLIFHFLGYYTLHYPYRREVYRLEKALNHNLNWFNKLKSKITIEYPERLKLFLKDTFRVQYHKLWGVRKIKSSERI